jgi:hypothetical protein
LHRSQTTTIARMSLNSMYCLVIVIPIPYFLPLAIMG